MPIHNFDWIVIFTNSKKYAKKWYNDPFSKTVKSGRIIRFLKTDSTEIEEDTVRFFYRLESCLIRIRMSVDESDHLLFTTCKPEMTLSITFGRRYARIISRTNRVKTCIGIFRCSTLLLYSGWHEDCLIFTLYTPLNH